MSAKTRATPLVSAIIPAYNAEPFIARTLTSVLNQTYRHLEVIVIDDGSTDRTADIVRQFASQDRRLTLYQQKNAGVAAARNCGVAKSKGEFIAPIDADDLWHKSNLEKQVALLAIADESVGMVYAWSIDIDAADCPTGNIRAAPYYGNIYPALLYFNIIGHGSACIIRRRCLEIVGEYSPDLRAQQAQGCEDWDLYLRIASRYQVGVVPELLVGYRLTSRSMSTQSAAMEKSQRLIFTDIESRWPQVRSRIRRWTASANYQYACRQFLNNRDFSQAWQSLYRALKCDPLIVLTTYESWIMLLLIPMQYLSDRWSLGQQPIAADSKKSSASRSLSAQKAQKRSLKTTIRQIISPLFPSSLVRRLRMKWVNAQVCPKRPEPNWLPERPINQLKAKMRLRSKLPDAPVDFGQHQLRTSNTAPGDRR